MIRETDNDGGINESVAGIGYFNKEQKDCKHIYGYHCGCWCYHHELSYNKGDEYLDEHDVKFTYCPKCGVKL